MFKPGVKIICVENSVLDYRLEIGKEYTILSIRNNFVSPKKKVFNLKEIRGAYDEINFGLSKKDERKQKLEKINHE